MVITSHLQSRPNQVQDRVPDTVRVGVGDRGLDHDKVIGRIMVRITGMGRIMGRIMVRGNDTNTNKVMGRI
jgi:hypothetical protein